MRIALFLIAVILVMMWLGYGDQKAMQACLQKHSYSVCHHTLYP